MWWVNLGWLPGAHQTVPSFSFLSKAGGERKMKNLVGRDKNKDIAHQLLSQANQTQLGKD